MPRYSFTLARTTQADFIAMIAACRTVEPTAGPVMIDINRWTVKTNTTLTAQQIASMKTAMENAPAVSPQRTAQNEIDGWPIAVKALVLTLIDQINVLRTRAGLATVTPAQALQAIRDKAATL